MNHFYFEPTSRVLNAGQVISQIGSLILSYSPERQLSIGLFPAFYDEAIEYNHFSETISGYTWTKFLSSSDLQTADPALYDRISSISGGYDTPFYVQVWNVVPLTGENETLGTNNARLKVSTESARLLSSLAGYLSQVDCPQYIRDYATEILALSSSPDYPHVLANDARLGTFASWPTYPDITDVVEVMEGGPFTSSTPDRTIILSPGASSFTTTDPKFATALATIGSNTGWSIEVGAGVYSEDGPVVIANTSQLQIYGPPAAGTTVATLTNGLILVDNAVGVRLSRFQIETQAVLISNPGMGKYFEQMQFDCLVVVDGSTGFMSFKECEFSGNLSVPYAFGGICYFVNCNFDPSSVFTLQQASPAQLVFINCTNIPMGTSNCVFGGLISFNTGLQTLFLNGSPVETNPSAPPPDLDVYRPGLNIPLASILGYRYFVFELEGTGHTINFRDLYTGPKAVNLHVEVNFISGTGTTPATFGSLVDWGAPIQVADGLPTSLSTDKRWFAEITVIPEASGIPADATVVVRSLVSVTQ